MVKNTRVSSFKVLNRSYYFSLLNTTKLLVLNCEMFFKVNNLAGAFSLKLVDVKATSMWIKSYEIIKNDEIRIVMCPWLFTTYKNCKLWSFFAQIKNIKPWISKCECWKQWANLSIRALELQGRSEKLR